MKKLFLLILMCLLCCNTIVVQAKVDTSSKAYKQGQKDGKADKKPAKDSENYLAGWNKGIKSAASYKQGKKDAKVPQYDKTNKGVGYEIGFKAGITVPEAYSNNKEAYKTWYISGISGVVSGTPANAAGKAGLKAGLKAAGSSVDGETNANGYTIKNDGKAKKKADIYCDSGLPSSFNGVKYYDVAIPYKLSCKDIGGYLESMSDEAKKIKQGTGIQYEMSYNRMISDMSNAYFKKPIADKAKSHWTSNLKGDKSTKTENGVEVVTDKNGTEFIMTAVQPFFFSGDKNDNKVFPKCEGSTAGQLIDAIMTDGTVVHMICADINAGVHTNGTKGTVAMIKKQYKHLFSYSNGNNLELTFGEGKTSSKSAKALQDNKALMYNGKRSIAYYRIYNKKFADAPQPASDNQKNLFTNIGTLDVISSNDADKPGNEDKVVSTGTFSENKFVQDKGMKDLVLDFADVNDLSASDNNTLQDWKGDLEKDKGDTWLIRGGRIITMFFGIIFTVWMIFIYLFYWLDRVNNFVDIDFLPIVTFNRLRISSTEQESTFSVRDLASGAQRTVNHKNIITICLVGIVFGVLIISGFMFNLINGIVTKALHVLKA